LLDNGKKYVKSEMIIRLLVVEDELKTAPRGADGYLALFASNVDEYERLARMVESMLFLARADHAQFDLAKQHLDPAEKLRRIAEYFEGVAEDTQVRLRVDATGTFALEADPILFRRAVNNLVVNAVRHTPRGRDYPGRTSVTKQNCHHCDG